MARVALLKLQYLDMQCVGQVAITVLEGKQYQGKCIRWRLDDIQRGWRSRSVYNPERMATGRNTGDRETEHKIRVLCDLSSISQLVLVAQVCRELLLYVRHGFTSQTKPFR